jgi:hypothetical protein
MPQIPVGSRARRTLCTDIFLEMRRTPRQTVLVVAGSDVLQVLGVPKAPELSENQWSHIHKIVGVSEKQPGIDKENMQLALTALLKGSLLAS